MTRLLVDAPAATPGLEFDSYAAVMTEIVASNDPNFAVGLFGSWGSGKTTLMRQIQKTLRS